MAAPRVGILGLGKLGLPVAIAMISRGVHVTGYDINENVWTYQRDPWSYPHKEAGLMPGSALQDCFRTVGFPEHADSPANLCARTDIIFVAVQTPHQARFGGAEPLGDERADFDYTHLRAAVESLAPHVRPDHTVVVISTCLPGTIRREVLPLLRGRCTLVYNPYFIAMGSVIPDFLNPEFVLIGEDSGPNRRPIEGCPSFASNASDRLSDFYHDIGIAAPARIMSYESAELAKVAYNLFIGFKIAFANTLGDICDSIPQADVDDVTGAIKAARTRLISECYLNAGMGDGCGCHPRDGIAMSWFAREIGLTYNPFDDVMRWRERHAEVLAHRLVEIRRRTGMPIAIYGYACKPETRMLDGSPALLTSHFLGQMQEQPIHYDPLVEPGAAPPSMPCAILVGCRHACLRDPELYPPGSIIIDPFRYLPDIEGCEVIRLGAVG